MSGYKLHILLAGRLVGLLAQHWKIGSRSHFRREVETRFLTICHCIVVINRTKAMKFGSGMQSGRIKWNTMMRVGAPQLNETKVLSKLYQCK